MGQLEYKHHLHKPDHLGSLGLDNHLHHLRQYQCRHQHHHQSRLHLGLLGSQLIGFHIQQPLELLASRYNILTSITSSSLLTLFRLGHSDCKLDHELSSSVEYATSFSLVTSNWYLGTKSNNSYLILWNTMSNQPIS